MSVEALTCRAEVINAAYRCNHMSENFLQTFHKTKYASPLKLHVGEKRLDRDKHR